MRSSTQILWTQSKWCAKRSLLLTLSSQLVIEKNKRGKVPSGKRSITVLVRTIIEWLCLGISLTREYSLFAPTRMNRSSISSTTVMSRPQQKLLLKVRTIAQSTQTSSFQYFLLERHPNSRVISFLGKLKRKTTGKENNLNLQKKSKMELSRFLDPCKRQSNQGFMLQSRG